MEVAPGAVHLAALPDRSTGSGRSWTPVARWSTATCRPTCRSCVAAGRCTSACCASDGTGTAGRTATSRRAATTTSAPVPPLPEFLRDARARAGGGCRHDDRSRISASSTTTMPTAGWACTRTRTKALSRWRPAFRSCRCPSAIRRASCSGACGVAIRSRRFALESGDGFVFGGPARLRYHGVVADHSRHGAAGARSGGPVQSDVPSVPERACLRRPDSIPPPIRSRANTTSLLGKLPPANMPVHQSEKIRAFWIEKAPLAADPGGGRQITLATANGDDVEHINRVHLRYQMRGPAS